jgi:hypothetical protein
MLLDRCPWYIAGPILGALIIGLRATANKPLGALGGYIDVIEHAARPWRLEFTAFVLAGIVRGGTLFTLSTGSLLPEALYRGLLPADPFLQVAIGLLGGVVFGFTLGLSAADGSPCDSRHAPA